MNSSQVFFLGFFLLDDLKHLCRDDAIRFAHSLYSLCTIFHSIMLCITHRP
jgi:hypothetical protein